ncbi:Bacillolysin precursor [Eubacteriaceae bacterium CHKCI004]|nr:Bacillolysin precursor [Eubacteriaceae bacterium CHKCI004]
MAKYCGKCGSKLDQVTGLCPSCDARIIKQHHKKLKTTKTSGYRKDISSNYKMDKRAKKKALKNRKKAIKKEKRDQWSTGKKVRSFLLKIIMTILLLLIIGIGVTGVLVYFKGVEIPVVEQMIERLGFDLTKQTNSLQFQSLSTGFTEQKIHDEKSALAALEDVAESIGDGDIYTEFSECEINTVSDNTYYRFQQEYSGIPVYGRSVIVVADKDGNSLSLSGNYVNKNDEKLNTSPKINEESAMEIAQQNYGKDAVIENEGLTFYSFNNCDFELTWKMYVSDYAVNKYCFISANSGNIIDELPLTYTERELCSGLDVDGEQQEFYAEYKDGKYVMEDTEKDISIYDANNSTLRVERFIMDSNNKLYHTDGTNFLDENNNIVYINGENFSYVITDEQGNIVGTDGEELTKLYTENIFTEVKPVTNDSTSWNNNKAVTLMSRLSSIYEFWQSEMKRNSHDNKYGAIIAVYDDYKEGDTTNARSDGLPGVPITTLSFGTDSSLSMNTISHEFMHSVERSISGMNGIAETGALMEAYSDIFGEIVEDWSNDGNLNNNCDWIFDGTRNMMSPNESISLDGSKEPLPDTYHGDYWADTDDISEKNDFGGTHINNTVISHAAYLMWKGINGSNYFESLSTEELADLFYETLYVLPSDCTFAQFRTLLQNTADIMCKQGRLNEKQRLCVSNAMFQVGITPATMPVKKEYLSVDVYDTNGSLYDDYTLYLQHENNEKEYSREEVNERGLTFPESGEYQLRIVDNANTDNETIVSVTVVDSGGVEKIPIFTRCGLSNPDDLLKNSESNSAFEKYLSAVEKTTESGSWSEQLTLDADMSITYDSGQTKTKMTLNSNSDISNYVKDDLSQIEISSLTDMKIMGQNYVWNTEYKDGVANYQYTEPFQQSQSLEIDPNFFNFETISKESILNEEISGDQIHFTVSGEKVAEIGIAAVQQISGINNLEYGDVDVAVTLDNSGTVDQIVMNFDASVTYQGYDADVTYKIQYTFA